MSTQPVNQLVDKLVISAHVFKVDDDGKIIALVRSGLLAHSLLGTIQTTIPTTIPGLIGNIGAKAAAAKAGGEAVVGATMAGAVVGGVVAGLLAEAIMWLGLAQIGEAKRAGDRIAALAVFFNAYVTTYVKSLAYFAIASHPDRPKPVTNLQALREWENFAINDTIAVLKAMGETDGRAVLNHLKAIYHTENNIVNALLPKVRQHCAQNVPPKVRRYLFS